MEGIENSVCMDLSSKCLDLLPDAVLQCQNVRMLCLEMNSLETLPDQLFSGLPKLTWLDVRNNKLKVLSPRVSDAKNLETLLLQDNCLQQLPVELALVPNLKTLHLSGNPVIYPSPDILGLGLIGIRNFLLSEYEALHSVHSEAGVGANTTTTTSASTKKQPKRRKGLPRKRLAPNVQQLVQLRRSKSVISSMSSRMPAIGVTGYKSTIENTHMNTPIRELSTSRRGRPPVKKLAVRSSSTVALKGDADRQMYDHGGDNNSSVGNGTLSPPRKPPFGQASPKARSQPVRNSERYVGVPEVSRSQLREKEQSLKELWSTRLRHLLEKQASIIQRQKTIEALKNWRQQVDKYRDRSSFSFENNQEVAPFDLDPDFNRMLSRNELQKLNSITEKRVKVVAKPRHRINISLKIDEIIKSIKCLDTLQQSTFSPQHEQKLLEREISRLNEIQKALCKLQCINEQEL